MPSDYYIKNIDCIRNRNKLSNRDYYRDNKDKILQNKRNRYKQLKQCKNSYFDLLPEDVQLKIYKKKHELEFLPTLNLIRKLRYLNHPNINFDMALKKSPSPLCDIHLRNGLLTQVSNRNNIIIDLRASRISHLFFYTSYSMIRAIQNKFDVSVTMTYRNKSNMCHCERCNARFRYDCANFKFNNSRNANPIIILEIVELLILLGIHYDDPDPDTIGTIYIYNISNIHSTRQRDIFALSAYDY